VGPGGDWSSGVGGGVGALAGYRSENSQFRYMFAIRILVNRQLP